LVTVNISPRTYELTDLDVAQLRNALQLKQASIRGMMNRQVTGSAIHKAYASELAEVTVLVDKFSV